MRSGRSDSEQAARLIAAFQQGQLSRRQLVKYLGTIFTGATLAAILAACGGSADDTPASSGSGAGSQGSSSGTQGSPAASADWAKAPVTFVYGESGEAQHIDPHVAVDFWSFTVTRNVYDPLVQVDDANATLVPSLATSWEDSADGLTHTFHLRENVTFTDGSKLDAETVKLNLDRVLAIKQGPAYLVNNIKEVKAVDPLTVAITTEAPDAYVAAHLVKVGIISGDALKKNTTSGDPQGKTFFDNNMVGCGPYKLEEWQRGSQLTLVKNEQWWGGWQPGSIDRIIIRPVQESSSRVQQFERGELDLINQWPVSEAIRVGNLAKFSLQQFNTFDTEPIFYLYTQKSPFDKREVRQAMDYVFDYKAMIDYYQGYAVTPAGPIPADYPGGAKDLQPFAQDLEKAKQMLTQAGVDPTSLDITFVLGSAGSDQFEAGATIFQDAIKKIGGKVTINKMPSAQVAQIYAKPETAGNITNLIQSPFTLDPLQFLAFYLPDNFYNYARLNDPSITQAIQTIKTTIDATQRERLLVDIQHQIRDTAPCIWGARPKTLVAVPDHVDGYVMQATDYRWSMNFRTIRIKAH